MSEPASNSAGFAEARRSAIPLPDYLDGIYSEPAGWIPYDLEIGYEKRPCMIRLRDGMEHGPCWPNAGKFREMSGQGEWPERLVASVAYYQ